MSHLRVFIGFATAPDHRVEETAGAVLDGLYENVGAFPTPPVPKPALEASLTAFTAAIAAQQTGAKLATAQKNSARDAVVDMLRLLAGYVQGACNNDLPTLLLSGFDAVSNGRAQTLLAVPGILSISNGNSGQLLLRITAIANARCYEVRQSATGGTQPPQWQSGGLFTDSRSMPVNGLTPGTNYTFQVRAVGGSTGYSGWSDPVSHMSL